MYLERSPEQRMLHETALRFFREQAAEPPWPEMAQLGLIAAAIREEHGGLGGRAEDVAPVCEAIGASGAHVQYVSLVLLPARLCELAAAAHPALLESFMRGESRVAVAHSERELVFGPEDPATQVDPAESRVAGRKERVWGADRAHTLIVSARGADGFGWYAVRAGSPGLDIQPAHDPVGASAASVLLQGAECSRIGGGESARAALDQAIALAITGVLAETVGGMTRLVDLSIEWLTGRSQFGRPLWSNQVLQHRVVDMFIALEESRSMLNLAIHACDSLEGSGRRAALHAAKAHVARAARFVGQQAVHLHGAMGLAEELNVGPAYRRLEALQAAFGGADYHVAAYSALAAPAA